MSNRNQKIFVLVAAGLVIIGLFYSFSSDTIFGSFLTKFMPVDWDQINPRNIVKTSIPIVLLEKIGDKCIAKAEKFEIVTDQRDFFHSQELKNRLQYNENEKTIIVPCTGLLGEKLRFSLWFVDKDDPIHGTKYDYFITPFNETGRN